jgi:prephenate dehydrogenase
MHIEWIEHNKHDTIEQQISHTPHAVERYGLVASAPQKTV